MDRRDRDQHNRNNYSNDYSGYDGYNREDEHYHSGRNLTNRFEQEYQRERGYGNQNHNMPARSYHEGDMGGAYERLSRERGYENQADNRYQNSGYSNMNNRNSYRDYQDNARSDRGMYSSDNNRNNDLRGNIAQGYGISGFGGTSDRFNTLNSDQNRGGAEYGQFNNRRSDNSFQNLGRGSSMGNSFPSSRHGVPDASYGMRNFADDYGSGMGSSYGGTNYGGGTGYSGGNHGGSFGNSSYGSSSGNYGGSSAMGGGTYGGRSSSGRSSTSHNSDRGTNELGGF